MQFFLLRALAVKFLFHQAPTIVFYVELVQHLPGDWCCTCLLARYVDCYALLGHGRVETMIKFSCPRRIVKCDVVEHRQCSLSDREDAASGAFVGNVSKVAHYHDRHREHGTPIKFLPMKFTTKLFEVRFCAAATPEDKKGHRVALKWTCV